MSALEGEAQRSRTGVGPAELLLLGGNCCWTRGKWWWWSSRVGAAATVEAAAEAAATVEAAGGKATAAATPACSQRGGKATPAFVVINMSRLSTLSFSTSLHWLLGKVHGAADAEQHRANVKCRKEKASYMF